MYNRDQYETKYLYIVTLLEIIAKDIIQKAQWNYDVISSYHIIVVSNNVIQYIYV